MAELKHGIEARLRIVCDCGNRFRADLMTECKQCGAHYEIELNQVAPPIGET